MENKEYQLLNQLENDHWWFISKRNFIKTLLSLVNLKPEAKILDIGCGTGINLKLLTQYGQVTGSDFSSTAIKFCQQKGFSKLLKASANKLPFKSPKFNLVTLFDVLYHQGIKDDQKVLNQVSKILKPKGYVLITDCAHQWLYSSHDKAQQARVRYQKKDLEAKVTKAGLSIIRSSYIYLTTFPLFIVKRLLFNYGSDVKKLNKVLNHILVMILKFEAQFLKQTNLPTGSSIIILAQK